MSLNCGIGLTVCYSLIFDNIENLKILYQVYTINDCLKMRFQKLDSKYSDLHSVDYEYPKFVNENAILDLFESTTSLEFKNKMEKLQIGEYTEVNFQLNVTSFEVKKVKDRTNCNIAIFNEFGLDPESFREAIKDGYKFFTNLGIEKDHIKMGYITNLHSCEDFVQ